MSQETFQAMDCLYVSKLNDNLDWYGNPFGGESMESVHFLKNHLSWSDKNILIYSPQQPICILDKSFVILHSFAKSTISSLFIALAHFLYLLSIPIVPQR